MLNKQLPLKVECLDYTIDDNKNKQEKSKERNEVLLGLTPMVKNEEEALLLLSENMEQDDNGRRKLVGAKLAGTFDTYVNLMIDKHKQDKDKMYCEGDDLILFEFL